MSADKRWKWKDIVKARRKIVFAVEKLRLAYINATTIVRGIGNTETRSMGKHKK